MSVIGTEEREAAKMLTCELPEAGEHAVRDRADGAAVASQVYKEKRKGQHVCRSPESKGMETHQEGRPQTH
jgi:hypothetical protein